jgi:hypothetical protein
MWTLKSKKLNEYICKLFVEMDYYLQHHCVTNFQHDRLSSRMWITFKVDNSRKNRKYMNKNIRCSILDVDYWLLLFSLVVNCWSHLDLNSLMDKLPLFTLNPHPFIDIFNVHLCIYFIVLCISNATFSWALLSFTFNHVSKVMCINHCHYNSNFAILMFI